MANVYVILGPTGSGRRELLLDLVPAAIEEEATFQGDIKDAAEEMNRLMPGSGPTMEEMGDMGHATAIVVLSQDEPPTDFDGPLAAIENATILKVPVSENGVLDLSSLEDRAEPDIIFLVCDGKHAPIDQLETLKEWLRSNCHDLGRIITVVHCALLQAKPELAPWFEACAHFSDVLLLNRREGVGNKWISDYSESFESAHYPCQIELVKKGKVTNPAAVLYPEPRRLSQYFDDLDELSPLLLDEFTEITTDGDSFAEDEDEEEAPTTIRELLKDDDDPPVEETYFTRQSNGQRVKQLPDISQFL